MFDIEKMVNNNSIPFVDVEPMAEQLLCILPHLDNESVTKLICKSYYITNDGFGYARGEADSYIDKEIDNCDTEEEQDDIINAAKNYFKNWEE